MKSRNTVLCLLAFFVVTMSGPAVAAPRQTALQYPAAHRGEVVDDYFGTKVADPYRWMEDLNSPKVAAWVEAENDVTFSYLDRIPQRKWIQRRFKQLWNYERISVPKRNDNGALYYRKNSGLQNQSPLYVRASLDTPAKLLLDPNTLSPDGSTALASYAPSPSGRYLAYALSEGGADWRTIRVMETVSGKQLSHEVKWVKFSGIDWTEDGQGFFYSRFAQPPAGKEIEQQVTHQQLYYHRLGTPQSDDTLIFERPNMPDWYVFGSISENGRYLFIYLNHGTETSNELFFVDLGDPNKPDVAAPVRPLFTANDAEYRVLGVVGDSLVLRTDLDAPHRRIVETKLSAPAPQNWKTVVPETDDVIESATVAGDQVVAQYLVDVKSELRRYDLDGTAVGTITLPGLGTVRSLSGRVDRPELFYSFTSYLQPATIYRVDLSTGASAVFHQPEVDFDPSEYETKEVFATSKDGTQVPLFITMKRGLKLDGSHPTLLYGYGGFDISEKPAFSLSVPVWLEMGGVYAVACMRGGAEYGEAWHHAGMLDKKQNVFDDFAAGAEYLIEHHYTSTPHLGIRGYSNGGLLVGASITQRPALFGAAYAGAGVMDMLRYQKFSAGIGWTPEYGSSDNEQAFHWLYAYSPLHNLKEGTCYPPTIITTADHDDRVVPSHSYKFAAEAQHDQGCDNPILIRIETKTSHGYMPTDKRIAQRADIYAFLAYELGARTPGE
jgi:prolyl oligopeptidase